MAAKLDTKPEEITATFLGERPFCRWGDTFVGQIRLSNGSAVNGKRLAGLKGDAAEGELVIGLDYLFLGNWSEYKNKRLGTVEKQFLFQTYNPSEPYERDGIIAYLIQAGQGRGIGPARAVAIFDAFGSSCVQKLRESPDEVAVKIRGLSIDDARDASVWLKDRQRLEACTISLAGLLTGRGFRKTLPRQLIQDYGGNAADVVRRDPLKLLTYPGCGWSNCDKMYLALDLPPGRLKRQALAAWHAINSNSEGHTWMPRAVAEYGIKSCVAGTDLKIDAAIALAIRAGRLREIITDGLGGPISATGTMSWLAAREKADNEDKLAGLISSAMTEPFEWPDIATIENIDREQPEVLGRALQGPIAILGGRPGSGKTFTVANLSKALLKKFGEGRIGIGAPTNLAAGRLTELLREHGVNIRARTWHSLLGKPQKRGKKWLHDEENPFQFKVIIGDEESMKDTDMMCAVFSARAKGTQVFLIGDVNQLLPVSHGAPLRDMIAAQLPYGELTEIRRNSGGIVEACSAIVDGRKWGAGDNLEIIEVDDPELQIAAVVDKIREAKASGIDPVWDTRVIVARNEVRRIINKVLQDELNHNPGIEGSPFRVNDKIINRETGNFPIVEVDLSDEETEVSERGDTVKVANGELARVLQVEEKFFIAKLIYPDRIIKIPRSAVSESAVESENEKTNTGCSWELAYGITFHSSQGSEFPWAIIVASTRDGRMGCRELIYTGISRGKSKCKLIGLKSTFDKFCRRVAIGKRKTFLRERIHLKSAQRVLAQL